MHLMIDNMSRFAIVQGLGRVFVTIGKLFIMCLSTLLGYLIITRV